MTSLVAQMVRRLSTMQETWVRSLGREDSLEKEMATHSSTSIKGFPGDSVDVGSIPGSRRSPGEANDNPLQYSCLENPMDREAWRAAVQRVTKESDVT